MLRVLCVLRVQVLGALAARWCCGSPFLRSQRILLTRELLAACVSARIATAKGSRRHGPEPQPWAHPSTENLPDKCVSARRGGWGAARVGGKEGWAGAGRGGAGRGGAFWLSSRLPVVGPVAAILERSCERAARAAGLAAVWGSQRRQWQHLAMHEGS